MPNIEDLKFSWTTARNGRVRNFETGSVVLLDAALRLALGKKLRLQIYLN
jgi:hypothetical protein